MGRKSFYAPEGSHFFAVFWIFDLSVSGEYGRKTSDFSSAHGVRLTGE
jgi:hypothetical protein